jgi:DNA-binding YbaB/EbfC family protein
MGSGFSKMKKQMRMMQDQMGQVKEKMQSTLVQGVAGNGLVTVTINGEKDLKKILIKPECVSDLEGLQDLIVAAFENAGSKLEGAAPKFPG